MIDDNNNFFGGGEITVSIIVAVVAETVDTVQFFTGYNMVPSTAARDPTTMGKVLPKKVLPIISAIKIKI